MEQPDPPVEGQLPNPTPQQQEPAKDNKAPAPAPLAENRQAADPQTDAGIPIQESLGIPAASETIASQPLSQDHDMAALAPVTVDDPNISLPSVAANGSAQPPLPSDSRTVSADEIALYDRQIRLWGIDAQAKIQSTDILLITMGALGNEIAKNLVLAGIRSLTILDTAIVQETDFGAQFLLADLGKSALGKNRAEMAANGLRKMNPRVSIHADARGLSEKPPAYFGTFDIIIATDLQPDTFNLVNTAARVNGKPFYAAGLHGLYGFFFSDLIEHEYVIKRERGNVPTPIGPETRTRFVVRVDQVGDTSTSSTSNDNPRSRFNKTITEAVTKRELYSTWDLASDVGLLPREYTRSPRRLRATTPLLSCLRALWEFNQLQRRGRLPGDPCDERRYMTQLAMQKHKALGLPSETLRPEFLRSFLQNVGSEIAPVAGVVGAQLAQDVINVLGANQQPVQNMVVFDADRMEMPVFALHPEGPLGNAMFALASRASSAGPTGSHPGVGVVAEGVQSVFDAGVALTTAEPGVGAILGMGDASSVP